MAHLSPERSAGSQPQMEILHTTNLDIGPDLTHSKMLHGAGQIVPGDRSLHEHFMREAISMVRSPCNLSQHPGSSQNNTDGLSQAELALATDETPVGCCFVHNGKVVGRGLNDTNRSLNVRSTPFPCI